MRRLAYFLARAVENLQARPWPTAVTVGTIALAFTLLAGYLVVYQALGRAADAWSARLEVSAYLADAVAEDEGRALAQRVTGWSEVAGASYVSKADALARFRAALAGQAALLEALPGNPLPASIEVALVPERRTGEGIRAVAARLGALPGVTDVEDGREEARRLVAIVRVVRLVGFSVAALLALVATLIVANTVRLALYARQEELEILRLVGATESFVRAPFLIEGALQGALGAAMAVALAALAHRLILPALLAVGDFLSPAAVAFLTPAASAVLVAGGALLGLTGSLLSVGRRGAR